MLSGQFEIISDEKGRISLPVKFKDELEGRKMVITKGLGLKCLSIYTKEAFDVMLEKLYSSPNFAFNEEVSALQRILIAPSVEFEVDKTQRFLIPQSLRAYAEIAPKSTLVVLGLVDRLEIWEKDKYEEYDAENQKTANERARGLFNFLEKKSGV